MYKDEVLGFPEAAVKRMTDYMALYPLFEIKSKDGAQSSSPMKIKLEAYLVWEPQGLLLELQN